MQAEGELCHAGIFDLKWSPHGEQGRPCLGLALTDGSLRLMLFSGSSVTSQESVHIGNGLATCMDFQQDAAVVCGSTSSGLLSIAQVSVVMRAAQPFLPLKSCQNSCTILPSCCRCRGPVSPGRRSGKLMTLRLGHAPSMIPRCGIDTWKALCTVSGMQ